MKEENIKIGRSMLENECKNRGFNLKELLTEDAFLMLSNRMSFNSQDEMFASVGYGAVSVGQIIVKLVDYFRKNQPKKEIVEKGFAKSGKSGGVTIKGMSDLLVRFAGCCNPVPGDEIVGFISRGHGITIHRKDCSNLKNIEDDRLVEANWTGTQSSIFNAEITVLGKTQTLILACVAQAVAELKLEIVSTNGRLDSRTKQVVVDFNISLSSKDQLEKLMQKLKQDNRIDDVYRAVK